MLPPNVSPKGMEKEFFFFIMPFSLLECFNGQLILCVKSARTKIENKSLLLNMHSVCWSTLVKVARTGLMHANVPDMASEETLVTFFMMSKSWALS